MNNSMNIGKSIKLALVHKDTSASQLAAKLGVSRQYMSAVINGHKPPTCMVLCSISQILGYKLSEMIALGED